MLNAIKETKPLINFAYSQKIDTPEFFIVLFFTEKLALLSLLKKVEPSTDSKMLKLLTFDNFDNLFPPLKVVLHETIRNDDFYRNTALQHCCDIVSNGYNLVQTLQRRCVALKIVVVNHPEFTREHYLLLRKSRTRHVLFS